MKLENREYPMSEVLQFDNPSWLVNGLVHRESAVFLSAAPKTGKSLFALRLAAAVSTGTPLFGHDCMQGNVLYLAAERAHLMKPRAMALHEKDIAIDTQRLMVYPQPVDFGSTKAVEQFAKALTQTPDLLVVDTLRRCFRGNENDSATMTEFCAGIELFCDLTGSSAVVIHHDHRERFNSYGRSMQSGFSGSGALLGSLDAYFSLQRNQNGTVRIHAKEANEGNDFEATARVERVDLGDHATFIMLETDSIQDASKPQLDEMVQVILQRLGRVTQGQLLKSCKSDDEINKRWPKLSKGTISKMTSDWEQNQMIAKEANPEHRQSPYLVWLG